MEQSDLIKMIGITAVSSVCAGFFGYYWSKAQRSREILAVRKANEALNKFNLFYDEVRIERLSIENQLGDFNEQMRVYLASQASTSPTQSPSSLTCSSPKKSASSVCPKRQQLLNNLQELMRTYPQYDATQRRNPDYTRTMHAALEAHHQQTVDVAALLFDELDKVLSLPSRALQMNVSR